MQKHIKLAIISIELAAMVLLLLMMPSCKEYGVNPDNRLQHLNKGQACHIDRGDIFNSGTYMPSSSIVYVQSVDQQHTTSSSISYNVTDSQGTIWQFPADELSDCK